MSEKTGKIQKFYASACAYFPFPISRVDFFAKITNIQGNRVPMNICDNSGGMYKFATQRGIFVPCPRSGGVTYYESGAAY